jgi:hypothetical protein
MDFLFPTEIHEEDVDEEEKNLEFLKESIKDKTMELRRMKEIVNQLREKLHDNGLDDDIDDRMEKKKSKAYHGFATLVRDNSNLSNDLKNELVVGEPNK